MILCRWCRVEDFNKCLLRELNIQGKCDMNVQTAVNDVLKRPCPTCHEWRIDLSLPCPHCGEIE